jgi:ATP-binding cassette subfamily B (MDR/TAP) protein 1
MFFPAHETTYVVGPSGSGKSSLAALLTRCYEPNYGVIELDEQLLNVLDEDWTRERIFHLGQGTILFEGTVEENVAIARRGGAGRAEVVAACRASLLHEFIRDLPDG